MHLAPVHRAWLRQAARTLVSVACAALVANLLGLQESGWALITAVIVTSNSVSSTWTAGRDQIVGTLIGAAAGTLAIELSLLGLPKLPVFALLLVPLALLAAARPTLRLTCVTLVVVFLFPSPGDPFERPFDRVVMILIGALVSLLVSYVVFRSRARAGAFSAASGMLSCLQSLLTSVMSVTGSQADHDRLTEAAAASLRALAEALTEARREHVSALEEADPLLVRLLPTLRRLQSDVLFVSRAVDELPDLAAHEASLLPARTTLAALFDGLGQSCDAIAAGRHKGGAGDTGQELAELDEAMTALGDTAGVPLRFTLQMLRRDLGDFEALLAEEPAFKRNTAPKAPA